LRFPSRLAAPYARLLAWDAPFLPEVGRVSGIDGDVEAELVARGVPLLHAVTWPRPRRLAVATQLIAAVEFLFEQGWFASRPLLRSARLERLDGGDLLRLGVLPRRTLDDARFSRRLALRVGFGVNPRAAVLAPLLRHLVPERRAALEEALATGAPWSGGGVLSVLTGDGRTAGALRHPRGAGRALWARRLAVPEAGVFWVEDDAALAAARAAAAVAAAAIDHGPLVFGGAFDEPEVARLQARSAADGRDALVLTTVPVAGAPPLAVAGGEAGVWVIGPSAEAARRHATAAIELSTGRAALAAEVLGRGAPTAFTGQPAAEASTRSNETLASPAARAALRWLRAVPVGLDAEELGALQGTTAAVAVAELERLRLIAWRGGRVTAIAEATAAPDRARLRELIERLPEGSWARCCATGLAGGDWGPLERVCEEALSRGEVETPLTAARGYVGSPSLALAGAEAALAVGRLADAERCLEAVPRERRGRRWQVLTAWWADQAGLAANAASALEPAAAGELPTRLAVRALLVAAEIARRDGDRDGELRHLREAVAQGGGAVTEAGLALAMAEGSRSLGEHVRREWRVWPVDVRARALHLIGYEAMSRGALAAAATALRAALRITSGANPKLLGEIHSDLGTIAILAEQPVVADRHLALAERFLERCGSRRAVTVVRHNRGVLANDRLDWRAAESLVLASRELRGAVVDSAYWFEEIELARSRLARGDLAAVRAMLAPLAAGLAQQARHGVLREAFAALCGQLALAEGDLAAAAESAATADDGERALLLAVVRAGEGVDPPPELAVRWGVAITARALARWRRGDHAGAQAAIEAAAKHAPREAAVALVRLAAILARAGEQLGPSWTGLRRRCEDDLVAADLPIWCDRLREVIGLDVGRLLEALSTAAAGGPQAIGPEALAGVGRSLGLRAIEVRCGGEVLASWGNGEGAASEVSSGSVRVIFSGPADGPARDALSLLAHLAAGVVVAPGEGGTAPAGGILGSSAAAEALRAEIARWAPLPLTILIQGEPGTGKELVARELHRTSGRSGRFVAVNCAGIPATLLEAELLGVVKGAYTGADRDRRGLVEEAELGTLFLDEIGELPLELQAKLLRLLQDREVRRVGGTASRKVDVRFVAATNRDLKAAVTAGQFRSDLYYRLCVAVIQIPPLRDRAEDIDELGQHFLIHYASAFGRPGVRLAPAALAALRAGRWPGNVRELDSAIARAVAGARPGEVIGADRFADIERSTAGEPSLLTWTAAVESFRRGYFASLLRATGGNRSEAARRAGLSRQALLYHLRHLGKLDA